MFVPKNCDLLKCELPADFDVSSSECKVSQVKVCSVNEIDNLDCYQRVTVEIKVIRVDEVFEISSGKRSKM